MICIAATNFPQSLDKALIRPGRFDRHVTVPNPDVKGRKEILEVHFKNVPAGKDVDLKVGCALTACSTKTYFAPYVMRACFTLLSYSNTMHMQTFKVTVGAVCVQIITA